MRITSRGRSQSATRSRCSHSLIDEALPGRLGVSLQPAPSFEPFNDGMVEVAPIRLTRRHRRRLSPMLFQVTPGTARFAFGRMRRPLAAHYGRVVGPLIADLAAGADVLHTWSADMVGAAALRAAQGLCRPCVITPFVHPGQWGTDPASVSVYRSADRVVALVDAERRVFADLDVPADRVAVSGVCTPGVAGGGGVELRRRDHVDGPLVLFLGARRPYKGHDLLMGAAGCVAESHPDATFAFVGPGEPLRVAGAPLRIIDAGLVDEQERAAWLDAADLLCLPSAHEIFPLSVIEGWSVGTPALVTDLPPLRELIGLGGGECFPTGRPGPSRRAWSGCWATVPACEGWARRGGVSGPSTALRRRRPGDTRLCTRRFSSVRELRSALVIGGAGFLGGDVIRELSGSGPRSQVWIGILVDASIGGPGRSRRMSPRASGRSMICCAARGSTPVFHMVGTGSVPRSLEHPLGDLAANAGAVLTVLEQLRDLPRRPLLVYLSSAAVYGEGVGGRWARTTRCVPYHRTGSRTTRVSSRTAVPPAVWASDRHDPTVLRLRAGPAQARRVRPPSATRGGGEPARDSGTRGGRTGARRTGGTQRGL